MSQVAPMLHLLCGKIAAGKSTLAAKLAEDGTTILISEDAWLAALYGDELETLADYVRCSKRLQAAMAPHVIALLQEGVSVVLDFPANTKSQRAWMRAVIARGNVAHQMHVLTPPDAVCLERLRARNASGTHAFAASEAQFHQFAKHFEEPTETEGFNIVR